MTEPRWYSVDRNGVATLCADRENAEREAAEAAWQWPVNAPYLAVQLADATGLLDQHRRDSAELRRLCAERDEARRERDELRSERENLAALVRRLCPQLHNAEPSGSEYRRLIDAVLDYLYGIGAEVAPLRGESNDA